MTAVRSTKEEYLYRKQRRGDYVANGCPFCVITKKHPQYIEETEFLMVIRNRLPYSLWDGQGVLDHLMVIPKEHTDKIGDLSAEAAVDYINLIDRYESAGYNLYARAPTSSVKSVEHQHTHLIRLDGKQRLLLFLLRKPFYIRLSISSQSIMASIRRTFRKIRF